MRLTCRFAELDEIGAGLSDVGTVTVDGGMSIHSSRVSLVSVGLPGGGTASLPTSVAFEVNLRLSAVGIFVVRGWVIIILSG